MGTLDGKIALVTGAGSGIGQAIAVRFAREGATVVVNDLSTAQSKDTLEKIRAESGEAHAIAADVSDADRVRAMFAEILSRFGRIDVLVNNAGIGHSNAEELALVNQTADAIMADMMAGKPPSVRFDFTRQVTDESWRKQLGVHLSGCFHCTREALRDMMPRGSGTIVNMSSAGALVGQPVFTHYSAAKGGMLSFTRAIAVEAGPYGVRVNAIAPGAIDTPLGAQLSRSFVGALIARAPAAARTPAKWCPNPDDAPVIATVLPSSRKRSRGEVAMRGGLF